MKDYFKIVFAMLIWSTWGLMIRRLDLPPVVVLFYTSLIASFTVPVVLKLRGDFPHEIFNLHSWHLFAALTVSSLVNNITFFYALGHTTVSNAVFTHYTAPVIVAVLAPLLISERLKRMTLISLPVAVAGMALIVLSGGGLSLNSAHLPGILAGTASGVAYAFVIISSRRLSMLLLHHKAIILLLWLTTLATAPAAFAADYSLTLTTAALLVVTGILHSTAAPLMYFSALRRVLAQHASILGYIEPLAAIPLAFLFLSEKPALAALFGGALILFSGYLVIHSRSNVEKES
jgi:drug/metabolite transporter (DMT)-like permease